MTPDETDAYKRLVGPILGGTNKNPNIEDINRAMEVCYTTTTRSLVELTITNKTGVMLVAKNITHQEHLAKLLISNKRTSS